MRVAAGTSLLFLLLPLCGAPALAQPGVDASTTAEQVVLGLSAPRAERMLTALSKPGGALLLFREKTGNASDDVRIGIRWVPPAEPVKSEAGWSLRGRLRMAIVKNPGVRTRVAMFWAFRWGIERLLGLEVPHTADMKFMYDKVVHVRYSAVKQELRVTLEGAQEEHGSFNLAVTQTVDQSFGADAAGSFGVNARSLSVDVQTSATQVTVVVAGLPYVVRPVLELKSLDGGDYITVAWGLLWESQVNLTATAQGVRDETGGKGKVKLGWGVGQGEVELEGSGYTRQSEFDSSITLESKGDGLRAVLLYDERVADRAYELVARANQQWQLHVDASPIVRVGSIQEEATRPIGQEDRAWLASWPPGGAPTGMESRGEAAFEFGPAAPLLRILDPRGLETEERRRGNILTRFEQSAPTPTNGLSGALDESR